MEDFGLSAFAVFFTQSPSFLAHQQAMQKARGVNNAQSVFGIQEIPSDNQVRGMLDPVPPSPSTRCMTRSTTPSAKPASWPCSGVSTTPRSSPWMAHGTTPPTKSTARVVPPSRVPVARPSTITAHSRPSSSRPDEPKSSPCARSSSPPRTPHQTRLRNRRGQALVGAAHRPVFGGNRHPLGR